MEQKRCRWMRSPMSTSTTDKPLVQGESPIPLSERLAYSLKESAAILGVSYPTAFRLVRDGKLRSSTALRTKLISRAEIERFLRES